MCKGRRKYSIEVDDLESDREWDDVETEVYNKLLQHRFTPIISEAEALHQVAPLAASRTLGITLRLGGVVAMVRVVMMVLGVIKGFGLLRIRIFGYCGIWVSYL